MPPFSQPDPQASPLAATQPPAPAPMPGMGGGFPTSPMMAQAGPPPAPGQPPAQQPSKVDAPAKPAKGDPAGYNDAQMMAWGLIAKDPTAVKSGWSEVFNQKIASKRDRLSVLHKAVMDGLPIDKLQHDKNFNSLLQYEKYLGVDPYVKRAPQLKPEYMSGLRVLHISLFGKASGETMSNAEAALKSGQISSMWGSGASGMRDLSKVPWEEQGIADYLWLLDSPGFKEKMALAPELYTVPSGDAPGMIHQSFNLAKYKKLGFSDDEMNFIAQYNRARGAMMGLRSVTGLARASDTLMRIYTQELPNLIFDNPKTGYYKLVQIQKEISAAMQDSQTSEREQSVGVQQAAPPPPPGFVPDVPR